MKNAAINLIKTATSRLRIKMIMLLSPLIALSFSLVAVVAYNYFSENSIQTYIQNAEIPLRILKLRTDDYFDKLKNSLLSFYSDIIFSFGDYSGNNGHNYKIKKLQEIYITTPETDSVLLYLPNDKELYIINSKINQSFQNAVEIEDMPWYLNSLDKDKTVLEASHIMSGYQDKYFLNTESPVFSISREMKAHGIRYAVLNINYRLDTLKRLLAESVLNDNANIVLLDNNGSLVCSSQGDAADIPLNAMYSFVSSSATAPAQYYDESSGKTYLVLHINTDSGMKLMQIIDMETVLAQPKMLRSVIAEISIATIILFLIIIIAVSVSITKPLRAVENAMKQIARGDFDVEVQVSGNDEISRIANTLNYMKSKIKSLINEEYRMTLKYKDAQFDALEHQINPHFISNTLQCIGSAAYDSNPEEIEAMTKSLSDMLRYSAKGDRHVVSLESEIENIKDYLKIQKFRFEDRLDCHINVQAADLKIKIPKLTLQPIVENAIIYGVEANKEKTYLLIDIKEALDYCVIVVADNGAGMDEQKLLELQTSLNNVKDELGSEHIGLRNICSRMFLLYGNLFSIRISKNEPHGVVVELSIPLNREVDSQC